jgi:predicted transcriptional regulator
MRSGPPLSVEHVVAVKARAHPDRLEVFFHLVQADKPLQSNEMQGELGLPGPPLSHHLDELERSGLIARQGPEQCIHSSVRQDMVVDHVRM